MAEAKGYVSDQLSGFPNEAGHCPGSFSVYAGPGGVGSRNQGLQSYPSTGSKEEIKNDSAHRSPEKD